MSLIGMMEHVRTDLRHLLTYGIMIVIEDCRRAVGWKGAKECR